MNNDTGDNDKYSPFLSNDELLKHAKDRAKKNKNRNNEDLSNNELKALIHEQRVHQIELEMQNEQLRWAESELERSRDTYFDFYELAPVGYFTMNEKGLITETNLTLAIIFGKVRSDLVKHPFSMNLVPEDRGVFYHNLKSFLETGLPDIWEIRIVKPGHAPFWVHINLTRFTDDKGARFCHGVVININDMKIKEEKLLCIIRELETIIRTQIDPDF